MISSAPADVIALVTIRPTSARPSSLPPPIAKPVPRDHCMAQTRASVGKMQAAARPESGTTRERAPRATALPRTSVARKISQAAPARRVPACGRAEPARPAVPTGRAAAPILAAIPPARRKESAGRCESRGREARSRPSPRSGRSPPSDPSAGEGSGEHSRRGCCAPPPRAHSERRRSRAKGSACRHR